MGRKQPPSVRLNEEERAWVLTFLNKGEPGARPLKRAPMGWRSSEGKPDREGAEALHPAPPTVSHLRKTYAPGGLETAVHDRPRPGGARKLTRKGEATLMAWACSAPPAGRPRWPMPWLADQLLALEGVDSMADEPVRRPLEQTRATRGSTSSGALAP